MHEPTPPPGSGRLTAEGWASDDGWLLVADLSDDRVYAQKRRIKLTHHVTFDEELAHAHTDAVDDYVSYLRRRSDVLIAFREDREDVLLAAPGLSLAAIGQDADDWLRRRARSS